MPIKHINKRVYPNSAFTKAYVQSPCQTQQEPSVIYQLVQQTICDQELPSLTLFFTTQKIVNSIVDQVLKHQTYFPKSRKQLV